MAALNLWGQTVEPLDSCASIWCAQYSVLLAESLMN